MDGRWNYEGFYKDYDCPEYKKDLANIKETIAQLSVWIDESLTTNTETIKTIEHFINVYNNVHLPIRKLSAFAKMRISVNANDVAAGKTSEIVNKSVASLSEIKTKFTLWLKNIDDLEMLAKESALISEHLAYFKRLCENAQHLLSAEQEKLILELRASGGSLWSRLHQKTTSNHTIELSIDGESKTYPLTMVIALSKHNDPAIRKYAFEEEMASYRRIEDNCAFALNGVKGEAIAVAKARGYASVLEQSLVNNYRMSEDSFQALLKSMQNAFVPLRKYLRYKAQLMGHTNGIPYYDLTASVNSNSKKYTVKEARTHIINCYSSFDKEIGDYVKHAFEHEWIDCIPRVGKRGGAFCVNIHPMKEFRVMSNFTGSFADINTFAHEFGHGVHGLCMQNVSFMNSQYPTTISETASNVGELLLKDYFINNTTKDESLLALETALNGYARKIFGVYCRFEIERRIVEHRENGALSAKEINDISTDVIKEVYGDTLNHSYLNPYLWLTRPHYYMPSINFYNIPYAFGMMFSLALFSCYKSNPQSFPKQYKEILSKTGTITVYVLRVVLFLTLIPIAIT